METKQTAVDILFNEIKDSKAFLPYHLFNYLEDVYRKSKQIEKEQIIDARASGFISSAEGWNGEVPCMKWTEVIRETKCEEYYNETYNK
jgi:hypothetical protein